MTTTPAVLFVCVRNSGKSQMAAGLMRRAAAGRVEAYSAGTDPVQGLNALSVQSLREVGVDIGDEVPNPSIRVCCAASIWPKSASTSRPNSRTVNRGNPAGRRRDHHHGLRRRLPPLPGPPLRGMDLDDPAAIRPIREEIETRVRHLLAELDIPTN
ncbi:arsenate reductase/protein-tyrosine-phosphatase family protein [Nocardia niwae]|uniref:arsenate reductase/protein-tyrosine-phosphatase family protein n=1 Tax=Nocardia niwae TaxID=626084 RepID=UPI0007A4072A|nr:hypothetical protein [Nocardia niwae]